MTRPITSGIITTITITTRTITTITAGTTAEAEPEGHILAR